MKILIKILFIPFILGIFYVPSLYAADERVVVDSLATDSVMLKIDFHAENLINDEIQERLLSGFTTIFEYKIQLWKKKTFLFSQVITEKAIRLKLTFDKWDSRYLIQTQDELRRTSSLKKVRELCLEVKKCDFYFLENLKKNSDYIITIRLLIKPISVENLAEIEKALRGENLSEDDVEDLKYTEDTPEVKNRFLKFLLAFTGLGDKVLISEDVVFQLDEQNNVIWKD